MTSSLLSGLFFHHGDGDDGHSSLHGGVGRLQDNSGSHLTYDEYDPSDPDRWSGYEGSYHSSGHGHGHKYSAYYEEEECCPLVVDLLNLVAILFSIAGATLLLSRLMAIELCNLAGQGMNMCLDQRRKKRAFGHDEVRLRPMLKGKHCEHSCLATLTV